MQLSEASLFMTFQNTAAIVLRDKGIVWVIHLLVGEPIKQLVIEAAWRPNKERGWGGGVCRRDQHKKCLLRGGCISATTSH